MIEQFPDIAARATEDLVRDLPGALERRDRRAINATIEALVARRAPLGRQWRSLAQVMTQNGEHRTAIAAIRLYGDATGSAAALIDEVLTLHAAGRVLEARDLLADAPAAGAPPATRAYLLGSLESMLGAFDRARDHLSEAVRLDANDGQAWLGLAMLDSLGRSNAVGDAIVAADPRRTGRREMRQPGAFFHALGKVFHDRGDHERAFDAFEHAASLARPSRRYDAAAEMDRVRRVLAGFDRALIDRIAAQVSIRTDRPIFVTGHPRSGTTLVEQILTSHSAVSGGGELDIMRIIGHEIGGPGAADLEGYVTRRAADDLAALHNHLLDQRFDEPGRIVDKRLLASRTLGVIAAILPDAPLIWLRRDPLDCAWSCFRTFLGTNAPWSLSLTSIAHHFRLEDELLDVWRDRLGSRLLVVPYEALVSDSATWTRQILSHCGLSEEPQVFAPHESRRAVTTVSVTQVREPINLKGIGSAEPYRPFLQPFIDAYYG